MPWAVVIRAEEEEVESDLTRRRAAEMESIRLGCKRWSPVPVKIRRKILPLFSNVQSPSDSILWMEEKVAKQYHSINLSPLKIGRAHV